MKNKRFPTKEEWDNIVNEAFSSDKMHDFSVRYELRRENIQKGITMKKTSNHIKSRYIGMVAAAAAIVIAAPMSIYAISRSMNNSAQLADTETDDVIATQTVITPEEPTEEAEIAPIGMQLEKNGEYQYILTFQPTEEEASDEQNYDVEYTWLPDGAYDDSERIGKHAFATAAGGTFDSCYFRVDADTPMKEKVGGIVQLDDVSNEEKTAYIFHRQNKDYSGLEDTNNFGRVSWIQFTNTNFVVELFATDDISDDDLKSIIDGMKLIPSDTTTVGTWFQREESSGGSSDIGSDTTGKSIDDYNIVSIGDTVSDENGFGHSVEITVNDAWVQDDFDGITTDGCGWGADYSEYLADDGKIYETYQYGTLGDGINTLDEITDTETVQKKVIVLDLTYKNVGDEDICEDIENCKVSYNIFPRLLIAPEWDCNWRVKCHKGDAVLMNHSKIASEDFLSLESDNKSGKNGINIPAGGETHVRVSLIANADDLDDLYVDFTGHTAVNKAPNGAKSPIIPVKDIK